MTNISCNRWLLLYSKHLLFLWKTVWTSDLSSNCPMQTVQKCLEPHQFKAGFRLACSSLHCCYLAWSLLPVSELQLSAATPLWLYYWTASLSSWTEVKCLQSAALGKADRLSIGWQDAAYRLQWSSLCAAVQISPSKRQCGDQQASLKAAEVFSRGLRFQKTLDKLERE